MSGCGEQLRGALHRCWIAPEVPCTAAGLLGQLAVVPQSVPSLLLAGRTAPCAVRSPMRAVSFMLRCDSPTEFVLFLVVSVVVQFRLQLLANAPVRSAPLDQPALLQVTLVLCDLRPLPGFAYALLH